MLIRQETLNPVFLSFSIAKVLSFPPEYKTATSFPVRVGGFKLNDRLSTFNNCDHFFSLLDPRDLSKFFIGASILERLARVYVEEDLGMNQTLYLSDEKVREYKLA